MPPPASYGQLQEGWRTPDIIFMLRGIGGVVGHSWKWLPTCL